MCSLLAIHAVNATAIGAFALLLWRHNGDYWRVFSFEERLIESLLASVTVIAVLVTTFFSVFFSNRMEVSVTRYGISSAMGKAWRSPIFPALLTGLPICTCPREHLFNVDIRSIVDVEARQTALPVGRRAQVAVKHAVIVVNNIVSHRVDRYVVASSSAGNAEEISSDWIDDLKQFLRGRGAPIVGVQR